MTEIIAEAEIGSDLVVVTRAASGAIIGGFGFASGHIDVEMASIQTLAAIRDYLPGRLEMKLTE